MSEVYLVQLGLGATVRADEIVAIDDPCGAILTIGSEKEAQAAVLLRNGYVVAAYVKPQTVRRRWAEALRQAFEPEVKADA